MSDGWLYPEQFNRSIERLAQNIFISVPALSQHAATAAFDCARELDENVARYAANRELLLRELPNVGITKFSSSDGAFYIYADVSHLTNNSEEFCRRLLNEAGVGIAPGVILTGCAAFLPSGSRLLAIRIPFLMLYPV